MYGISWEIYKTPDPKDKTPVWADLCITCLRRDWVPLVNQERMRENKRLIDSMQSMEWIKEKFKDKAFKKEMQWDPLGIMEVFKNILIEDIIKDPPKAELKATDPSAISDRKKDIIKLKNRKIVEGDINQVQSQVMEKMPKYRYDAKKFKGNVGEFDRLNLNENDPEDMTFYEQELQRLNYEIAGQSVLDIIFKVCRFDLDIIEKIVRDILSAKALTMQTYVDKITGEIKCKYLYPETFYGIFGDSGDGRNDIAGGWVDNITINEWLQLVGNEFEWDRDWRKLLWAINYCGNTKYTGFIRNNTPYDCCGNRDWMKEGQLNEGTQSNLIEWTMAFNYQINCGYVEWKVEEATSTIIKSVKNKNYVDVVPYRYELAEKKIVEGYYKESNYQQQMYGSYFISTTSVSQWIFGFSKVYFQKLEGANDEYSNGTLKYYLLPGKSAAEIGRPYIRMANHAFYKMLWVIDKAKPEDDVYVYEELIQISKTFQKMYPQNSSDKVPTIDTILKDIIKYQRENLVRIRSYPKIDGKPVLQLPPLEGKRNGIDPIYVAMQAVLTWAEMQIGAKIGVNPMRTGMNPPARESEKSEMNAIQSSIDATSYIYRMIQYTKSRLGTDILNFTQDIIQYKNIDTVPYKWLKQIIGNEDFETLYLLDDYCAHRFAIFVNDYSVTQFKQKVLQMADMAVSKKQIELDQWGMIISMEDPKKAMKLLAVYRRKKEKKERKQALQDMKIKQEMEAAQQKHEKDILGMKIKGELEKAKIESDGLVKSAQVQSDGRIKVKEITVEAEDPKQAAKAEASIQVNKNKEKDKESKPFPAVAGG